MTNKKVFCIGFQKTGTSSLGVALEQLGHRVAGYWEFRDLADANRLTMDEIRDRALRLAKDFDAFKDTPWPLFYREFDQAFPGAKFILVIRDTQKWIDSAVGDFGEVENSIHQLIYGAPYPKGHEAEWIKRYEQHNRDVQAYFKDRPGDLLAVHMDKGELNWACLCEFLGVDAPDKPWPHANTKSAKRWKTLYWRLKAKLGLS